MSKKEKLGSVQTSASEQLAGSVMVIRVPSAPLIAGQHITRSIDLRLPPKEAEKLREMFNGLHDGHYTTAGGRHIDTLSQVFIYMIQNAKVEAPGAS